MNKPLIVANWKMNTTLADASVLATMVRNQLHHLSLVDVVICPPTIWMQEVASVLEVSAPHIYLGAQNCYHEDEGAFTGEVSAKMLKDLCSFVILGHSERRHYFHESLDLINDKVQAVLRHNMTPIVCVGEDRRGEGSVEKAVRDLRELLAGVSKDELKKVVVAYEPVWAIGTGEAATGEYVERVGEAIKQAFAKEVRVLYGGSVVAENVTHFTKQPSIDGVLVGGASLKAQQFVALCQNIARS